MDKYMTANAVFSKFSRTYMDLKKDLPIRPSEMAVLNIITLRGGRYTPLMLAEILGVSKSMIAIHLRVLSQKGYIYKEFSPNDKRSFYVLPTEEAIALTADFKIKQSAHLKTIESAIGAEKFEELIQLMDQTLPTLEELNEELRHAK